MLNLKVAANIFVRENGKENVDQKWRKKWGWKNKRKTPINETNDYFSNKQESKKRAVSPKV